MVHMAGVVFTYFFVDDIDYPLPLVYYIPFLRPVNSVTYAINFIHQLVMLGYVLLHFAFLLNCSFVYFLHSLNMFDVLNMITSESDSLITSMGFEEWLQLANELMIFIRR